MDLLVHWGGIPIIRDDSLLISTVWSWEVFDKDLWGDARLCNEWQQGPELVHGRVPLWCQWRLSKILLSFFVPEWQKKKKKSEERSRRQWLNIFGGDQSRIFNNGGSVLAMPNWHSGTDRRMTVKQSWRGGWKVSPDWPGGCGVF